MSRCFSSPVGVTRPAGQLPAEDHLVEAGGFSSWGAWSFCRFSSEEYPAVRMGFEKGSFNMGVEPREPDPGLLQLHLEIMGRKGAILWLPTGTLPADRLGVRSADREIILEDHGHRIVSIRGWPDVVWCAESGDGRARVQLEGTIETVSVLPDCLLPHSLFAMWVSTAAVRGAVTWNGESAAVEGTMFFDHPRVLRSSHEVAPRTRYLYTTMALKSGAAIFGYHAEDPNGSLINDYCFGFYIDPEHEGRFLPRARTNIREYDQEGLPRLWSLEWADDEVQLVGSVTARQTSIVASWGSRTAPKTRRQFSIIPLVLDGEVGVGIKGHRRTSVLARGLAEYWDADLWPSWRIHEPS